MPIFSTTSESEFISQYWQRHPLVFRQCFGDLAALINGNDLAGLACKHEVESRIISGFEIDGQWRCRQGPFQEKVFEQLPTNNWALLIQNIDYWDVGVRKLLSSFSFLPSWRLDDIMASYAPMGGGVGPHFDYYDVFLIQVSGSRKWKLGPSCDDTTALQDNQDVKLLAEFECQQSHLLKPGDMLYIPAGHSHWGTALTDDCITLSVGFRAPSDKEIIQRALENMMLDMNNPKRYPEHHRYRDSSLSMDAQTSKINKHVLANLPVNKIDSNQLTNSIERAFGELVTKPSDLVQDELENANANQTKQNHPDSDDLAGISNEIKLNRPAGFRFAYSDSYLFVNGVAFESDESFARTVCDGVLKPPFTSQQQALIIDLLEQNFLRLEGIDV